MSCSSGVKCSLSLFGQFTRDQNWSDPFLFLFPPFSHLCSVSFRLLVPTACSRLICDSDFLAWFSKRKKHCIYWPSKELAYKEVSHPLTSTLSQLFSSVNDVESLHYLYQTLKSPAIHDLQVSHYCHLFILPFCPSIFPFLLDHLDRICHYWHVIYNLTSLYLSYVSLKTVSTVSPTSRPSVPLLPAHVHRRFIIFLLPHCFFLCLLPFTTYLLQDLVRFKSLLSSLSVVSTCVLMWYCRALALNN